MTHPSDPSSSYGQGGPGPSPGGGSWPAHGAPQGGQAPGAPQGGQSPGAPQGGQAPGAPQGGHPGYGGPSAGPPGQPPPPGGPGSPRTGLRAWHLLLAAVIALVLGGVAGFAGGFYVLGGGVTGSDVQEQRDRIAELERQVSDLEEELAAADDGTDTDSGAVDGTSVRIGVPQGWDEIAAASQVWAQALEATGYEVEIVELPEVGVLYTALANGEVDMSFGSWVPSNQDYLDQHGEDLEDLGSWFDDARMGIVVNEDAPITSLAELADHAEEFDGEILGIEEGAGVVQLTNQEAVPTYGLEDLTVSTSSTRDMLEDVAAAMDAGENVAATFWSPHWVLDELPLRFLEDPEGAFGEPESIHAYATEGFSTDQPELASCLAEISLTTEQVNSMVNTALTDAGQGDPAGAQQWLAENPDVVCDALS